MGVQAVEISTRGQSHSVYGGSHGHTVSRAPFRNPLIHFAVIILVGKTNAFATLWEVGCLLLG